MSNELKCICGTVRKPKHPNVSSWGHYCFNEMCPLSHYQMYEDRWDVIHTLSKSRGPLSETIIKEMEETVNRLEENDLHQQDVWIEPSTSIEEACGSYRCFLGDKVIYDFNQNPDRKEVAEDVLKLSAVNLCFNIRSNIRSAYFSYFNRYWGLTQKEFDYISALDRTLEEIQGFIDILKTGARYV